MNLYFVKYIPMFNRKMEYSLIRIIFSISISISKYICFFLPEFNKNNKKYAKEINYHLA